MIYVITEKSKTTEKIINILHTNLENVVKKWIIEYLVNEIQSLTFCPCKKNVFEINYKIEETGIEYMLVKSYKVKNGFFSTNYTKYREEMLKIKYQKFDTDNEVYEMDFIKYETGIFEHLNKIFLNKSNRDTLLEIFLMLNECINSKNNWNKQEYNLLLNEIIKHHRNKELNNKS